MFSMIGIRAGPFTEPSGQLPVIGFVREHQTALPAKLFDGYAWVFFPYPEVQDGFSLIFHRGFVVGDLREQIPLANGSDCYLTVPSYCTSPPACLATFFGWLSAPCPCS